MKSAVECAFIACRRNYDQRAMRVADGANAESFRPEFLELIFPAQLANESRSFRRSDEHRRIIGISRDVHWTSQQTRATDSQFIANSSERRRGSSHGN